MDYHYPDELNEDFGVPLTEYCQEVASTAVFTRKWSKATVSVDCNTLSAKIAMADGRVLSSTDDLRPADLRWPQHPQPPLAASLLESPLLASTQD